MVLVGGFGKTQIRVDTYFALKKIEADWAPEWARPAGSEGPRLDGLGPFGPIFRVRSLLLIPHLIPVVTMR